MANPRAFRLPRSRFDENGKRLCTVPDCMTPLPPRRRSWCSNEHMRLGYDELGRFASAIHWRDGGTCALCGIDCDALLEWCQANGAGAARALVREGFDVFTSLGGHRWFKVLWHADHIIPVCEGGETTMENGRILCHPCHKQVTREMHARHKKQRVKQMPLIDS